MLIDDSSLKSTTSLPVGVPTPTSDDDKSHGNVVSGLVENFQASIEVTVGISETLSRSDTPKCPMLKRKKQVSRSQISSSDHHLEANNTADLEITSSVKDDDDDDAFDTSFDHEYVSIYNCNHLIYHCAKNFTGTCCPGNNYHTVQ